MTPTTNLSSNGGVRASLTLQHVSKTFPGQRALNDVSIDLHGGRTHALLGHNGSGKSTLIKVLAGIYVPDAGAQIQLAGHGLTHGSPRESRRLGLRFVHQDLGLVGELSASENMALTWGYPRRFGLVRSGDHDQRVEEALARLGATLNPNVPVAELRAVQRAAVAIARAISDAQHDIAVLVLDEPTASLPATEVETLFNIIREVRSQGVSVLYVSHRLDEIVEIADDVSVLRDGNLVATGPLGLRGKADLVRLVLGDGSPDMATERAQHSKPAARVGGGFRIRVNTERLSEVELTVAPGEILGIAGLDGSGREDFCAAVVGAVPGQSELIDVARKIELRRVTPVSARKMGVALVLSNRETGAAIHEFSVRENLSLPSLSAVVRAGFVRKKVEASRSATWMQKLAIKPPDAEVVYTLLSGGNQQKTVLAKWLAISPRLMLLDDPTTGVDIGARSRIYDLIMGQARNGLPVIVASSDIEDLTGLCDRIVVLRRGQVSGELIGADITEERLLNELNGAAHE